jgi:hypothetical protein
MSFENTTYAFQNAATTGVGVNQFFPEPRFTTFRIIGNGSVSAGAVTIECCPGSAPMTATPLLSGSPTIWSALSTITVPANTTTEYRAGSVSGTPTARPGSRSRAQSIMTTTPVGSPSASTVRSVARSV